MASLDDLDRIWSWNGTVHETAGQCVHNMFAKVACRRPDAAAVCAWDGDLTYRQLDELSSQLARRMAQHGVMPGVIVPLCLPKSKWAPIAMLAVMKAGGASVALDTAQPEERLRSIIDQVGASLIVCVSSTSELAARLTSVTSVIIDTENLSSLATPSATEAGKGSFLVAPSDLLYVVFTSGSTGIPKGVLITHANFASAARYQRQFLRFHEDSRVFDFASYAFDASWSNMLHTLTAGGCLCIPSDYDRKNRIGDSMRKLRVNYADVTPSVAELLAPALLPKLEVLVLGGEPLERERLSCLGIPETVLNTYGPAECTIIVTGVDITTDDTGNNNIGRGIGCTTWVVDPDDHDQLLPIGALGELLIEGPLVGSGYLHDSDKTSTVFIENPPWLLRGAPGVSGRHGRLYKTGDLVRYNADGTLAFVGRKDTQVKIHGQRVEMAEVEHHVRRFLPVGEQPRIVAELVTPHGRGQQTLAVFITPPGAAGQTEKMVAEKVAIMTAGLRKELVAQIPLYMVPSVYIPLPSIPMTPTGKTDRKSIREKGALFLAVKKSAPTLHSSSVALLTAAETLLAHTWEVALRSPDLSLTAEDNFFAVGGDSIGAMRLVALARDKGLSLSVNSIFLNPSLREMALAIQPVLGEDGIVDRAASKITSRRIHKPALTVPRLYLEHFSDVDDVFPSTPLQSALFSLSQRDPQLYLGQHPCRLRPNTDIARLKDAVERILEASPILRTIFIPNPDPAFSDLLQAVVRRECIPWVEFAGPLADFLAEDHQKPFRFGHPTARVALVSEPGEETNVTYFVLTAHHAVYDGWSLALQLQNIDRVYQGMDMLPSVLFRSFVESVHPYEGERAYWMGQLAGFSGCDFPRLPRPDYQPVTKASIQMPVAIDRSNTSSPLTIATILRAAWAVAVATYANTDDVVIGATLSGRNASVDGIERVNGPTFTTVPVRLRPSRRKRVLDFLTEVQRNGAEMVPFEHTGLLRIAEMGPSCKTACNSRSLLVIQPSSSLAAIYGVDAKDGLMSFEEVGSHINYSYGFVLECLLTTGGVIFRAIFDTSVMIEEEAWQILQTVENIVQKICRESPTHTLGELRSAGDIDYAKLLSRVPEVTSVQGLLHDAIGYHSMKAPTDHAICAWDGTMSFTELENRSSLLAAHLTRIGVRTETMVPTCIAKSKWALVAIFAILKSGGVYVPLDPCAPEARLRAIAGQTKASVCLISATHRSLCSGLFQQCVTVDESLLETAISEALQINGGKVDPISISPSQAAYVMFTSGSTGQPKGVVVEHGALMHSALAHGSAFGMSNRTRAFQFSSFTFDTSLTEMLTTLLHGGCVCMPSDAARQDRLAQAIVDLGANWALLTPSVASAISPDAVPTLETLVLAGEAMDAGHVRTWSHAVRLVNGYGPTECCIFSVINAVGMSEADPSNIGYPTGCRAWVVDPADYDILLPIGSVGELLLEGPLLARGYLDDQAKTAASFIHTPAWSSVDESQPGRRLYKTGDLVRFRHDGTLTYVGRADRQAKLHGQRMELADVEINLRHLLQPGDEILEIHADIVTPTSSSDAHLVAFIRLRQGFDVRDDLVSAPTEGLAVRLKSLCEQMSARVLRYMVPTLFVPIRSWPVTSSGKLDRSALKTLASGFTSAELARFAHAESKYKAPESAVEMRMQVIWSNVLGAKATLIGRDANFFALGGDSLSALRVATQAQAAGMSVSVSDVFACPILQHLSKIAQNTKAEAVASSTLTGPLASDTDLFHLSRQLALGRDAIEDAYEATSYQGIATVTTLLRTRGNTNYYLFSLCGPIDSARLRAACLEVFQRHDLLRTVFAAARRRVWQVVLKSPEFVFHQFENVDNPEVFARRLSQDDLTVPVRLGQLMTRFALIRGAGDYNVLWMKISHAQYDALSLKKIQGDLENAYSNRPLLPSLWFRDFIRHVHASEPKARAFWTDYLTGSTMPRFLNHTGPAYRNIMEGSWEVRRFIPASSLGYLGITDSNLIKSAWAYTLACFMQQPDVIFAVLSSGRNVPVPGIEDIAGPTVNHVPWRVRLQKGWSALDLARTVQAQQAATMPHESTPFRRIIEDYTDWPKWTRFTSIVHHMHKNILDIDSLKLGDVEAKVWSFEPGSDRCDVWVRSRVCDDQFDIILMTGKGAIPVPILEALLDFVCKTISAFAAHPEALLQDPLATAAYSNLPQLPLQILPPRPPIGQANFFHSAFRTLVQNAWIQVLGINEEEFQLQDVEVTPDTAFFDIWGDMLAAQQLAEFYSNHSFGVLLEDILENPTMGAQATLLLERYGSGDEEQARGAPLVAAGAPI